MSQQTIVVNMKLSRQTKNSLLYLAEVTNEPPKIQNIYVPKWALPTTPLNIKVTVEVTD